MKYLKLFLFLIAGMLAISAAAYGQDGPPPDDARDERPDGQRPNLLAELGLTREQIQQIRRINQDRRPAMMDAQRRMHEANRNLDMAIYKDTVSDEEFQLRLREVQAAQSELARLRFESELAIRKVLSPEQLIRFRELRQRFEQMMREKRQDRREMRRDGGPPPMGDRPMRRPPI